MSEPQSSMSLGQTDSAVFLKVDGPATMTLGPAFTALCDRCREHLDRPIYVDLSGCDRIDSTFAGCLVGQSVRTSRGNGPGFALVCPSSQCRDALAQMGLDRLLKVDDVKPPGTGAFTVVACETFSSQRVIETVVEAHERLAELSEANARTFGPIAAAFKADLERKRAGGQV